MKTSEGNLFKRLKLTTVYILTAVIFYPILICFVLPILIYRQFVILIVRVTDPQCQKIVTGISAFLTGSQPYEKPPMVIVPYIFLDDHVNVQKIIRTIDDKIIKRSIYPELRQKLVPKFGYHFWKTMENFSLENHVRYYNPESPNTPVLLSTVRNNIAKALSKLPFETQRSPWEIVVVPNVFDPGNSQVKSAVLFRLNHALFDGQSGMKFVEKLSAHPWSWVSSKTMAADKKSTDTWKTVKKTLKLILTGPYHALQFGVFSKDQSEFLDNVFKIKELDWKVPKETTEHISIENLKAIAKDHNVGMSSVITTSVTVGAANFMRKKCDAGFAKLPENFILHLVLPLPGHPDNKLTNWWSMVRLRINLEETQNPVEFAKKMHTKYLKLAQSVAPLANYLTLALAGALPLQLRPDAGRTDQRQTVMFSNFPGPKETVNVFGANVQATATMAGGSMGTAFVATSRGLYDKVHVEVASLPTVYENENDVKLMHNCIKNVLGEMKGDESINK